MRLRFSRIIMVIAVIFAILSYVFGWGKNIPDENDNEFPVESTQMKTMKEKNVEVIEKKFDSSIAVTNKERPHIYTDTVTGMEFVFVKGGCYERGNIFGNERLKYYSLVNKACVSDFYISKYEVTQKQWTTIMENNPSQFKDCNNCPVENVNWDDAIKYIISLNKRTGQNYRLPTEAEWEYAARSGGKREKWAGTNNESELNDYAWFKDNSEKKYHPVGQKKPNGLGLYDMSGNVFEWCWDRYDMKYYDYSPINNPTGPSSNSMFSNHVMRGGNSLECHVLTTSRFQFFAELKPKGLGFRLAMTP